MGDGRRKKKEKKKEIPFSLNHPSQVLCGSTDYRDLRKAAYQEYAIATASTVCKLPTHIPLTTAAALGVAYIAAALALSICLGLPLPTIGRASPHPDTLALVRAAALQHRLPADTIAECTALRDAERPRRGEWLIIWGGSATSALFCAQMARLAGLKVVLVLDVAKHGARMLAWGLPHVLFVDSHCPERARDVIRGLTAAEGVWYGLDTVGKQSTELLASCMHAGSGSGPDTNDADGEGRRAHVVGLAAVPNEPREGVVYHTVPLKLFHELPEVGTSLMTWLEVTLDVQLFHLPHIELAPGSLEGINAALDQMRQGHISGRRLVVPV